LTIRESLNARLREASFIVTMGFSLFLLLALCTYHITDPSWTHTGSSGAVQNSTGIVGSWLADLSLTLLGYVAYALPIMLCFFSWVLFIKQKDQEFSKPMFWLRSLGFVLTLICASALVNLYSPPVSYLPAQSGGIVGSLLGGGLESIFNLTGASLILIAILLCGATLCFGVSWFALADNLGKGVSYLGGGSAKGIAAALKGSGKAIASIFKRSTKAIKDKSAQKSTFQAYGDAVESPATQPNLAVKKPKKEKKPKIEKVPKPRVEKIKSAKTKKITSDFSPAALIDLNALDEADNSGVDKLSKTELEMLSSEVEQRLHEFGIQAKVVGVHPGPVITRFELEPAPGVKASRITGIATDLARSLAAISVRVVEVIPGKSVVGLEIPNRSREIVSLKEVLVSAQYQQARSPLSMALGKDIAGNPVVVDLGKMPHLLVAGTTGSGKSVGVNAMLLSFLYKATPEEVRMILVDPKMLELSVYDGIPHLLTPVVTDMKEAANALRWCVAEMERRYRLMAGQGVRNLSGYNEKIKAAKAAGKPIKAPEWYCQEGEEKDLETLPMIVVVIDEFADMMMVVGKKVEQLIARLAQKARAAGVHLILATQRPSVDVITGLIKANIPTRIAFQVSSKIDSRTVLDQQGAQQLLGHGDMLYLAPGTGLPVRVHGAFVGDDEVHRVVAMWKEHADPDYLELSVSGGGEDGMPGMSGDDEDGERDALYDEAVQIVIDTRRASISSIQRRLKIGYNRAARLVETMEESGLVGPMENNGAREILIPESSA
jgi:DNA segregation ATPase FtsK/SpoIIIE, S-DNA-T family